MSDAPLERLLPYEPPHRDRGLHVWVVAQFFAWFSDAAFVVGLGWTALHTLGATPAGMVVALAGLTQFVTGFPGGIVTDHHDPRIVLRLCAAGELITLTITGILWQAGLHATALFFVTAVFGVLTGMGRPARSAWTRSLVDRNDMPRLVSWSQMASRVAQFSGGPAGAFVVARGGFPATLAVTALGAAAMSLTLWRLTARLILPRQEAASAGAALEGLRYLRRHRDAGWLVIGISATNVCLIPLMSIGLAMISSESHWGATWVGYGDAAVAMSALVGSAGAPRLTKGCPARVSFLLLMLQGLAIPCVTNGTQTLYLAALCVIGMTAGIASVQLSSIYLAAIDPAYLGRVGSWVGALDLVLGPIVTPIWTWLAGATSLRTTGLMFGAVCVVLGVLLTAATWTLNVQAEGES